VLVCANPFSGHGPNRRTVDALLSLLRSSGLDVNATWTPAERAEALRSLQRQGADDAVVVAAGGDGSISDVVSELGRLDLDVPLALLPIGNENLVARHLRLRRDAQQAARWIIAGHVRTLDRGLIERHGQPDRRFTLMVGAGFDADVVHRVDRWRKKGGASVKRIAWHHYVPHMLGSMRGYPFPGVEVIADGQPVGQGAHAFVFNLPEYGKDLGIGKHADPADGQLDWVLFERPGRVKLVGYMASVALGRRHLRRPDVRHGRARTIELRPLGPEMAPLQADGDPVGHTPVTLRVQPGKLRLITGDWPAP
jgi:diacylglycerol kinase (ATP)